ncbi:hypothetical protein PIB30_070666, partial [Stylosanthes scabra]|nr:hypothetical protein [Stylosanthes scabra]
MGWCDAVKKAVDSGGMLKLEDDASRFQWWFGLMMLIRGSENRLCVIMCETGSDLNDGARLNKKKKNEM